MKGLSPRTWLLVQRLFPLHAETAGLMLVVECGRNLPFCHDSDELQLERLRFAALKLSRGNLYKLQEAIDDLEQDWRDVLVWAGFADELDAHLAWAKRVLGE